MQEADTVPQNQIPVTTMISRVIKGKFVIISRLFLRFPDFSRDFPTFPKISRLFLNFHVISRIFSYRRHQRSPKYEDEDQDHDFTKFSEFREPLPPVKIEEDVNDPRLKRLRAARETIQESIKEGT